MPQAHILLITARLAPDGNGPDGTVYRKPSIDTTLSSM